MTQPALNSTQATEAAIDATDESSNRNAQSRQAGNYTLKIIFSGIVPLVPVHEGTKPKRLWALVTNLTEPGKLPHLNGHDLSKLPPHVGRLLFEKRHLVDAGGRTVSDGELCPEGRILQYVTLANEDLELRVKSVETSLEIITGTMAPPVPCNPRSPKCPAKPPQNEQEEDFGWTIDIDTVAKYLTPKGKTKPKLQQALLQKPYKPTGFSLLAARFAFERGKVTTQALHKKTGGGFEISTFGLSDSSGKPIHKRTEATRVVLTLRVEGEVTFAVNSLDGGGSKTPIVIGNCGDSELLLYIDNHPDLTCKQQKQHVHRPHFLVNYCLFDNPNTLHKFLVPRSVHGGHPVLNAQCSPPRFTDI